MVLSNYANEEFLVQVIQKDPEEEKKEEKKEEDENKKEESEEYDSGEDNPDADEGEKEDDPVFTKAKSDSQLNSLLFTTNKPL